MLENLVGGGRRGTGQEMWLTVRGSSSCCLIDHKGQTLVGEVDFCLQKSMQVNSHSTLEMSISMN